MILFNMIVCFELCPVFLIANFAIDKHIERRQFQVAVWWYYISIRCWINFVLLVWWIYFRLKTCLPMYRCIEIARNTSHLNSTWINLQNIIILALNNNSSAWALRHLMLQPRILKCSFNSELHQCRGDI